MTIPAYDRNLPGFLVAQAGLDSQFRAEPSFPGDESGGSKCPGIFKFNDDRTKVIPVRFMTGELGLGDPFQMKFFRGVAAYGIGHLQMRVYVDKSAIPINLPLTHPSYGERVTYGDIEMAETPDPQRVLWLPRGTKGRTINIEASGLIRHIRSIVVFWDPLRGEEDG